jgi:D-alanyl-D-alanine carboxypeptidase/D-alanyl-D-alanine-endopeptidase (penicillin-binding protein 4)
VAVDYPPLLLGRVLADRLARAGVGVEGSLCLKPLSKDALADARTVATHRTDLADVLARANKRSLNLAAECLLLRSGDYTWAGSAKQAHRTLVEGFGLSERDLTVADGSGLSRRNRVAARAVTRLLAELARRDDGSVLLRSLPIAGVDGSLRRRLGDRRYRGRIVAKTGTLAGVSCLAGYVLDRAGEKGEPVAAFAVLCNGLSGRQRAAADQLENALAILLVDHVDAQSAR